MLSLLGKHECFKLHIAGSGSFKLTLTGTQRWRDRAVNSFGVIQAQELQYHGREQAHAW